MDPKELREQVVRDAKCAVILDAARSVFSEKGLWETRLEDIAAQAGFSKASLYNYFPDKEAIFLTLAVREYQTLLAAFEKEISADAPFAQNLQRAVSLVMHHFGEHFALVLNTSNYQSMMALHANMNRNEDLAKQFKEYMGRIMTIFVQLVKWGRTRGDIKSPLDDITIAGFVGGLVRGVLFDWKVSGRIGSIDESLGNVCEFVMSGAAVGAR